MKNFMLLAAISFIVGIFAASKLLPEMVIILGSFLLVLVLAFLNRHKETNLKAVLMLAICLFGMFEYNVFYNSESKLERYTDSDIIINCIITDDPIDRDAYTELRVKSVSLYDKGRTYNYTEKLILRYKGTDSFKFGDLIEVSGKLLNIAGKRNPGDFDYISYYKSKGINKSLQIQNIRLVAGNKQGIAAKILNSAKNRIKRIVFKALPKREAAMIYGMLTGHKEEIDKETMDAFKASGIAHILSVSGLHVGFLVLLLNILLKPFKLNIRYQGIIIIAVVLFYILMIGMPSPAVRAFIMLAVMLLGKIINREYNLIASISFAAIVMLAANPLSIHNPGVIISFSCMYSIALLYEPVNKLMRKVPKPIREPLSLSLAVWIGITPVMAWYFNYVSLISILLNLIAVPFALVITIVGFAGVFVGSIFFYGSLYVFSAGYYLIKVLLFIADSSIKLPFAGITVPTLPIYLYGLYYLGVLFLVNWFDSLHYKNYRKYYKTAGIITFIIGISIYLLPGNLTINYFDIGQGDSACIITPNKRVVLIDGGGSAAKGQYYNDIGRRITVPALLHQGVWKIDIIIATHAHDDHIEGLLAVVDAFKVKNIIFPKLDYDKIEMSDTYKELVRLCSLKGTKIHYLGKSDVIKPSNNIRMEVLAPNPAFEDLAIRNLNNSSLVIKLVYKNFEALFTGDIEAEVEAILKDENIKADILKVAHHGSSTSSTKEFLESVEPLYAIISVGKNNFGHPKQEVLERLDMMNIKTLRTDQAGGITVTTNGNAMKIKTIK